MKVESTAAVGIRNRDMSDIDAVSAETTNASITNASIVTAPVHD